MGIDAQMVNLPKVIAVKFQNSDLKQAYLYLSNVLVTTDLWPFEV